MTKARQAARARDTQIRAWAKIAAGLAGAARVRSERPPQTRAGSPAGSEPSPPAGR